MELIRTSKFAEFVSNSIDNFTLVDIGCSGGVHPNWNSFGDKLHVWGFDVNIQEVARLNASSPDNIKYFDGAIVGRNRKKPAGRNPWYRLAVYRTLKLTQERRLAASSEEKTAANDWHLTEMSKREIHLPSFFKEQGLSSIDFVKIDIDGPDFDVIESLKTTFSTHQVIGVCMEVNWIGSGSPDEHSFHNTDRFLRECGFDLYDFTKRTYSLAALPSSYALPFPAQSVSGRPLQGDAVYLRDLAYPAQKKRAERYSPEKLLKLAAMFAMIGQPDSAANVLLTFRDRLEPIFLVDQGLEHLFAESGWADKFSSYSDLVAAFDNDDRRFYPS